MGKVEDKILGRNLGNLVVGTVCWDKEQVGTVHWDRMGAVGRVCWDKEMGAVCLDKLVTAAEDNCSSD